jgi:hypothetical protein
MKLAVTMVMLLVLAAGPLYGQNPDQPPPTPEQEQPEVLTSGPVHEAFAEPVNVEPQAGLVVPDEPPAQIQEVPPDERPAGSQFVWVPGYWAWDASRNGYIWVSACWRAAPPKTYWVPGYWARVPEGWEWIPGFWAPVGGQSIEYLPAPPAIENVEPPGPPPSPDVMWVPPCRYWYDGHYILRSGYWLRGQPDWVWVPSHYTWTPRGYVFVPGHWDYALERRGVLFAPVFFPRHIRARPGFSYQLSIVVDLGVLRLNLFTYPRYSHYCFGDWYDDAYLRIGIYPRWESERIRVCYDPIYRYDRWRHVRTDPHWVENERHEYDLRRADRNLRPPRTYHEMEIREAKLPELQRRNLQIAQPLNRVIARRETAMKFEPVGRSEQRRITRQATEVRKFGDERVRWESPAVSHRTVGPLAERQEVAKPPIERREPTAGSLERKAPAKPPVTPAPTERRAEGSPAAQRPFGPGAEHAPPFVSPRDLKMTQPETVRIPRPPIVGRGAPQSRQEAVTPSSPTEERQSPRAPKGRASDRSRNKEKD